MTALSAKGTRLNRKGQETRQNLLRVAVHCLAEGGPEGVSASRVVREAGLTWGTVQHQFGDADGLWAAVIGSIAAGSPALVPVSAAADSVAGRVEAFLAVLWEAMDRPAVRATHNLRMALPGNRADLEAEYPLTASALAAWDAQWEQAVHQAFADLAVDPVRLQRVRAFVPSAVRGLHEERFLSTYVDLAAARAGLTEAITAYLTAP